MIETKEDSNTTSSHLETMAEVDERGVASIPDLKLSVEEQDVNNPQVSHCSLKHLIQAEP
jgi:hypothetical protein